MKRFLIGALIVVLVLGGFAFYMNWLTVSTSNSPDKSDSGIRIALNKGKVQQDVEKAQEKLEQTGDNVRAALTGKKISGHIQSINPAKDFITVVSPDGKKEVEVALDSKTQVYLWNIPATNRDLGRNDNVAVVYEERDGRQVAHSVTVNSSEQTGDNVRAAQTDKNIKGHIQSINSAKDFITVMSSDGKQALDIALVPETQVNLWNTPATNRDLGRDDTVFVVFEERDGRRVATSVTIGD
jgi:hypothetical protein